MLCPSVRAPFPPVHHRDAFVSAISSAKASAFASAVADAEDAEAAVAVAWRAHAAGSPPPQPEQARRAADAGGNDDTIDPSDVMNIIHDDPSDQMRTAEESAHVGRLVQMQRRLGEIELIADALDSELTPHESPPEAWESPPLKAPPREQAPLGDPLRDPVREGAELLEARLTPLGLTPLEARARLERASSASAALAEAERLDALDAQAERLAGHSQKLRCLEAQLLKAEEEHHEEKQLVQRLATHLESMATPERASAQKAEQVQQEERELVEFLAARLEMMTAEEASAQAEEVAPQEVAPQEVAYQKVSHQKVSHQKVAHQKVAPQKTSLERSSCQVQPRSLPRGEQQERARSSLSARPRGASSMGASSGGSGSGSSRGKHRSRAELAPKAEPAPTASLSSGQPNGGGRGGGRGGGEGRGGSGVGRGGSRGSAHELGTVGSQRRTSVGSSVCTPPRPTPPATSEGGATRSSSRRDPQLERLREGGSEKGGQRLERRDRQLQLTRQQQQEMHLGARLDAVEQLLGTFGI